MRRFQHLVRWAAVLIDAPIGTTVPEAIAGRGTTGTINFNTGSSRAVLCFPHVKRYDTATDTEVLEPLSQRLAGVIAAKDIEKGYCMAATATQISITINARTKEAQENLIAVGGSLATLSDRAKTANVQLEQIDAFRQLKTETQAAQAAWQQATQKVTALAREMAAVEAPTQKQASAFERAKTAAAKLKDAYIKSSTALEQQWRTMDAADYRSLQDSFRDMLAE